jgi:hypothetical protein
MTDRPDDLDPERERIRAHFRAELDRVAAIPPAVRDAEVVLVQQIADARRRSAA